MTLIEKLSKEQRETAKKYLAQAADIVDKEETTAIAIAITDIGGASVMVHGDSNELIKGAANILRVVADELELSPDAVGEGVKKMLSQMAYPKGGGIDLEKEVKWIKTVKAPLIKDEKIRKAVRTWAEANDIEEASIQNNYCLAGKTDEDVTIIFAPPIFKDIGNADFYTIEELCGEEK